MSKEPLWFLNDGLKKSVSNFRPGDDAIPIAIGIWLAVETGNWLVMFLIFAGATLLNLVGKFAMQWFIKRKLDA